MLIRKDKGMSTGDLLTIAHQGYRHVALDFLVLICQMGDDKTDIIKIIMFPNERTVRIL